MNDSTGNLGMRSVWRTFLASRHAPLLTHLSLAVMTAGMFALLLSLPFAFAFLPCALLHHRIGILVHEYIHGIPFRRYRSNHDVVTFYDGLLLSFGFLELFRATHLAHHKWLNSTRDPARQAAAGSGGPQNRFLRSLWALEASQHARFMWQSFSGKHPLVKRRRMVYGLLLSLAWVGFWIAIGRPEMVLYLALLALVTTMVSSSLRGAIEHHGAPGEDRSTNEYRTFIPLFNMNRHAHHHASPTTPWYRLEFQTPDPLPRRVFITHWINVYVRKKYVMMRPERQDTAP